MLTLLLAFTIIYARWAPDSWLGRAANGLVDRSCRWLASIRPLTIICFIIFVAALVALVAYGKFDGLMMAGPAAPEGLAMFLTMDVGTAVEVMLVAWLVGVRGHASAAIGLLRLAHRHLVRTLGARPRARKARRPRKPVCADNDDDPEALEIGHRSPLAA